jgi:hypothetical protein
MNKSTFTVFYGRQIYGCDIEKTTDLAANKQLTNLIT